LFIEGSGDGFIYLRRLKMASEQDRLVQIARALGDTTRWQMLSEIRRSGELTASQVQESFDLAQPTISHHLAMLREAGLVSVRKEGVFRYMSAVPDAITQFAEALASGATGKGPRKAAKPAARKAAKRAARR
jgi:ArsR family transcriptional regulator, arsenate/arsenite/antimonite-responsive transcriptional repressor